MFNEKSRYLKLEPYMATDHRGRQVMVVPTPAAPVQDLLGYHVLRQGQRLDLLAAKYIDDPAGFWRICEQNDVMLPEALTEAPEIAIPDKGT